ncbi:amidase family protein [Bradyrhizobium liaoningense]|uniref:amidase family protein n=1 Tax=Bradyrhizobium liaoningense TaxID=43992 RepID=UPI002012BA9E|nr:amidase family protein [Bradyrhizobium liaoningense]
MSADPIHYKSIIEISELFRRGELLPSKVTEVMLGRIAKLDQKFHGYALVLAERAMAQAKRCDAELAKGIWRGPLHGVGIDPQVVAASSGATGGKFGTVRFGCSRTSVVDLACDGQWHQQALRRRASAA